MLAQHENDMVDWAYHDITCQVLVETRQWFGEVAPHCRTEVPEFEQTNFEGLPFIPKMLQCIIMIEHS